MKSHQRRQIMVDQPVQGVLTARVAIYWSMGMGATLFSGWIWQFWYPSDSESSLFPTGILPAVIGSLVVLPLAIVDMIRVSNRFVGPVHSLRNQLKCLSLGDSVRPLELRKGDYWNDLVRQFNEVVKVRIEGQGASLRDGSSVVETPSKQDASVSDHCGCPSDGSVPADVGFFGALPYSSR